MAIPLDKDGNKRKENTSGSKYRLEDSERKLPRPIVFWSDNEKDAFRRNKVVQTRYYMLLDDIEIQQKSSQKSIRHEAHKFRKRYKADIISAGDIGTSVGISDLSSTISENVSRGITREKTFGSGMGCDINNAWGDIPKAGVITKIRNRNVKFSDEVVPTVNDDHIEKVKTATDKHAQHNAIILRSQSATQKRSLVTSPDTQNYRSKSAMMQTEDYFLENNHEQLYNVVKPVINSRKTEKVSLQPGKQTRKPNSTFFDRSQAAYQLRKELQKLAKVRNHGMVKVAFTMEDAIREERNKLTASTKKVAEYIQKLELDQRNMKINEWTTKTIDPAIS